MKFIFLSHLDYNLYRFRLPVMKALVAAGHNVHAVCPAGDFSEGFAGEGIIHHHLFLDRRSCNPLKELLTIAHIVRLLKLIRPDVLHTFIAKPNIYGCIAARFFPGIKVVASVTGLGSFFLPGNISWKTKIIELLFRGALLRADRLLFQNTDDLTHFVDKRLCPENRTVLIRGSGVDTDFFSPSTDKPAVSQPLTIGMVARLSRAKGIMEYIAAAEELNRESGCRFMLIGEPDPGNHDNFSEAELRAIRDREFLQMPGFQEDVRPFLHQMDIFCLPSYREGLPMSVLEAMACGLPIVTTDVPGCRETVASGVNGFLVTPRDAESLAEGLRQLIGNPHLLAPFGAASRQKVCREFSIKSVLEQTMGLYEELTGAGLQS